MPSGVRQVARLVSAVHECAPVARTTSRARRRAPGNRVGRAADRARDKVDEEGEGEDGSRAEGGTADRVGEVVPAQADDSNGHEGRDRAGDDHERGASHPGRGAPCRSWSRTPRTVARVMADAVCPLGKDS